MTRDFGDGLVLEAPGFTPWFDSWMKLTMQAVPSGLEHEFTRTSLGCIFVVSADQADPIEALKALSQTQVTKNITTFSWAIYPKSLQHC